MAGRQDIAPARAQDAQVVGHFLAHLSHGPKWQGVLVVNRAVEYQLVAEIRLQAFPLHPARAPLDRVEHIDPGLDHIGDNRPAVAVVVVENVSPGLVSQVGMVGEILLAGGVAKNASVVKEFEAALHVTLADPVLDPQVLGAFGAALLARDGALGSLSHCERSPLPGEKQVG